MHERNTARDNEEVDIGRRHEVQRVYRKQLMYYTISHAFIDIAGIIVSYSFLQTFVLKRKETPLDKTAHNPDSQSWPRLCIYLISQTADHLQAFLSLNGVLRLV